MHYEATLVQKHVCKYCKGSFDQRSNLEKHVQQIHKQRSSSNARSRICPLCGLMCLKIEVYRNHLRHLHGYEEEKSEIINFKYITDFHSWKKELEKRNYCKFLLHAPLKSLPSGDKIHVYHCDSSIPSSQHKNSKDRQRYLPKHTCPAVICVLEYAKSHEVKVEYWDKHVGHSVPIIDDEEDELEAATNFIQAPEIVVMTEEQYEEQYADNSSFFITESNDASCSDSYKESPKLKKKLFHDKSPQTSSVNSKSFSFKKDQKKKISSFGFSLASVACMKPSIKKTPATPSNLIQSDENSTLVGNLDSNTEVSAAISTVVNESPNANDKDISTPVVTSSTSSSKNSPTISNIVNLASTSGASAQPPSISPSKLADLANINDGILNGKFILLRSTDDDGKQNLILCPVDIPGQATKENADSQKKDGPSLMRSILKEQKENKASSKKGQNKYDQIKRKIEKDASSSEYKKARLSNNNDDFPSSVDDPAPVIIVPASKDKTSATVSLTNASAYVSNMAPVSLTNATAYVSNIAPVSSMVQGSVPGQNFSAYPPGQAFMMTSNNTLVPIPTPQPGQAYVSTIPQMNQAPSNVPRMPINSPAGNIIRPLFTNTPSLSNGQFLLMPQTPGSITSHPFALTPAMSQTPSRPVFNGSPMVIGSGPPMTSFISSSVVPEISKPVETSLSTSSMLPGTSASISKTTSFISSLSSLGTSSSAKPMSSAPVSMPLMAGRNPIVSATISSAISTGSILRRVAHATKASTVILNSGPGSVNLSTESIPLPKVRNFSPKAPALTKENIVKKEPATWSPTTPTTNLKLPSLPTRGNFLLESADGVFMVEPLNEPPKKMDKTINILATSSLSKPKVQSNTSPIIKSEIFSNINPSTDVDSKAKSPPKKNAGVVIQSVLQTKRPMKDETEMEIMKKIKFYQLEMKYLSSEAECKRLKLELARSRQKEKEEERKKYLKDEAKSGNEKAADITNDNSVVCTVSDDPINKTEEGDLTVQKQISPKEKTRDSGQEDKWTDSEKDESPMEDDFAGNDDFDAAETTEAAQYEVEAEKNSDAGGFSTTTAAEKSLQKIKKYCGDNVPVEIYTMIQTSVLRSLYADMKDLCEENKKLFEELQKFRSHEQFVNVINEKLESL